MSDKYILYARKSTDVEDKQVLSIEAQLAELRTYAKNEGLQIIDELVEKKSAKTPGRPIFAQMLRRIEAGEASGIIAWHPDRLARNSIDGGQIVYLLDQTHLQSLKFPTFWFENTSQGKFMLSIAFGQSKYYIDNLAENTKRGLRQKVRRGEFPGLAPIGYINDVRVHIIIVDKRRAPLIGQAFELYAVGNKRLQDIADFLAGGKTMYKTIDKLIEQARKDLARKRLAAVRRQRERALFTLERRATLTLKENRHV
jgi:DNA invertase Pin-like site-specific DNA recombinase